MNTINQANNQNSYSSSYWKELEKQDKFDNLKGIRGFLCIELPVIGFLASYKFMKEDKQEIKTCIILTIIGILFWNFSFFNIF